MRKLIVLVVMLTLVGCVTTEIEYQSPDGTTAKYMSKEQFRSRNTEVTYDPSTGQISVKIIREKDVSDETMQAFAAVLSTVAGGTD